jgi:hypothetical protein
MTVPAAAVAPFTLLVEFSDDIFEVTFRWATPPFIQRIGSDAFTSRAALADFAIYVMHDSLIRCQHRTSRLLDPVRYPHQHYRAGQYLFEPSLQPLQALDQIFSH